MKGKAIYQPKGKAGEYAKWACNFFVGCSNDCEYCYCKRGILGHAMGKPQATLKKCFKDKEHALEVFKKELQANLDELRQHGLFFTFTSDPFIKDCKKLTISAVGYAVSFGVCCKILTKRADFINDLPEEWFVNDWYKSRIAFGFTLTGRDDLERGASTNVERIVCMGDLHNCGFKTFASIEPVIDISRSYQIIRQSLTWCDLYKIGLISGKREYTPDDVRGFMHDVGMIVLLHNYKYGTDIRVYWKDSLLQYAKIDRSELADELKENGYCANSDYNIFK